MSRSSMRILMAVVRTWLPTIISVVSLHCSQQLHYSLTTFSLYPFLFRLAWRKSYRHIPDCSITVFPLRLPVLFLLWSSIYAGFENQVQRSPCPVISLSRSCSLRSERDWFAWLP